MATFVSTTLTKRTGATTTTFSPLGMDSGVGTLADTSAANQALGSKITMSSKRPGGNKRVTRIRVSVPNLDLTVPTVPKLLSTSFVDVSITIPDGVATSQVNDLSGYLEKIFATATTNFNDLIVNGQGVY